MITYIAGPMSKVADWNKAAFAAAAEAITKRGDTPINPHELHPDPGPWREGIDKDTSFRRKWREYLRRDIGFLAKADEVEVLPGWRDSEGACVETAIAHLLGIPIYEHGSRKPVLPHMGFTGCHWLSSVAAPGGYPDDQDD